MKFYCRLLFFCLVCILPASAQNKNAEAAKIYNTALELQQNGKTDKALAGYDQAITLNPRMEKAYNNRANIKLSRGDNAGAIADFTKVIEINPKYPLSYYNRGNIYLEQNDNDRAIADFTKAIEIFAGYTHEYDKLAHAQAYAGRASALQNKGSIKECLADYDKALEILPQSAESYINRGTAKQSLKDYQGAIADYTRAIEIQPKNAVVYFDRAPVLEELDDTAAINDYTKSIALDPAQAQPYARRGLLYLKQNKKAAAVQDLEKAFGLDASSKTYYADYLKEARKR